MKWNKFISVLTLLSCFIITNAQSDSTLTHVSYINQGNYASVKNAESRLQSIARTLQKDSMTKTELVRIIQNVKDWNMGESPYKIDINIILLEKLLTIDEKQDTLKQDILIQDTSIESENPFKWYHYTIPLILILLAFGLYYFLRKKIKRMENEINQLNELMSELNKKYDSLFEKVALLETKYSELEHKYVPSFSSKPERSIPLEIQNKPQIKPSNILYAKSTKNDIFLSKYTKKERNANLYFQLMISPQSCTYTIVDNFEIQDLLVTNGYDGAKSAFKEENPRTNFKSKIINITPGTLTKVENGWKIDQKLKIKYT